MPIDNAHHHRFHRNSMTQKNRRLRSETTNRFGTWVTPLATPRAQWHASIHATVSDIGYNSYSADDSIVYLALLQMCHTVILYSMKYLLFFRRTIFREKHAMIESFPIVIYVIYSILSTIFFELFHLSACILVVGLYVLYTFAKLHARLQSCDAQYLEYYIHKKVSHRFPLLSMYYLLSRFFFPFRVAVVYNFVCPIHNVSAYLCARVCVCM